MAQWGYEQSQINYAYSSSGNITEHENVGTRRIYEYDATERLITFTEDGTHIATYQHDPLNRRISKITGMALNRKITYFFYVEEGLIAEIRRGNFESKTYGWEPSSAWGTRLIWFADHYIILKNSVYHFSHNDHLGTPQIVANKFGAEAWSMVAQSFGETVVSKSASTELNMRFPG
ncbi:RHS repeat domain-containing protein [Lampropedia aestuarii]|uniref:RHS repeat domain-containing protein n=1 Tax=Lampropedia aestuarii TaxID=2562762 RepID=UPI00246994DA|nr:hypothetical protein [Lampropedia aestuarii]MDH5859281.1 hypothetical protein [Lampropedia aestuarii]